MFRKINERYMKWYNKNPEKTKAICINNVIGFSFILIVLALLERYDLLKIVIWIWGLSIANLVVEWKRQQ